MIRRAAVLAVAAALTVGGGTAWAATFPTNVSIQFVPGGARDVFKGVVSSPNNNCIDHRRVRLLRRDAGPDTLIDRDRSEDNGRWNIDVEGGAAPGTYYVRVTAKDIGPDTCAGAKSGTVTV
jgi:hypothetical protein